MEKIGFILATFLLALMLLAQSYASNLPDLGEHSAITLTPQEEKQLAQEFMQEVRQSFPLVHDAIINDYIQSIGNKLVRHTSAPSRKFNFFVLQSPIINAFAGPDANVGVFAGLILATRSESELASVMSHEIAHVTQHHIARLIERSKATTIPAIAGALAAILIGATTGGGNVATGAAMASMAGAEQHLINFTRENEAEADHIGIQTLYQSGFDPRAMANFFAHMQQLSFDYGNEVPAYLLDHPVTNERIADARARANQYPTKNLSDNTTYLLMRTRLQAFMFNDPARAADYFKTQLQKAASHPECWQYGYALALFGNRQYQAAAKESAELKQKLPNEVLVTMLDAQIAANNNRTEQAIAILKSALATEPYYFPLIVQYGSTLMDAKQPQAAAIFLKQKTLKYSDNADLFFLLAQAQANSHKIADAYQSRARGYEILGAYRQAGWLLQQALKVPNLSATDKAVIMAKIERLKKKD